MSKGGRRDKAELRFEKSVYTPDGAKSISNDDLRQEYSRLRSIAEKRLKRFQGSEWTDSQVYQLNVGKYKPLAEIENDRELRHLFSDVAKFITAYTGGVAGLEKQRREGIKTFNAHGYDFVNKENYREFADFMEYSRTMKLNRIYDSKRIADFYEAAEKKKLSRDEMYKQFKSWTRKQKKQKKIQNINPRNSSQYRKDVDN